MVENIYENLLDFYFIKKSMTEKKKQSNKIKIEISFHRHEKLFAT